MQKTALNEVFELLQQIGAVSNESEFSKDWLCRSECYMRTLRFKRVKPSVGIWLYVQANYSTTDAVGWWKDEVRV